MGANNSIALNRASTSLVSGQEIDYDTPWRNATFKRRADCGREGGAMPHSILAGGFGPVYTFAFGCNNKPQFAQSPGCSAEDGALIIYRSNEFCDAGYVNGEPISPMRFIKGPSIDDRARTNDASRALLHVLLSARRRNPDIDTISPDGTPTFRKFRTRRILWAADFSILRWRFILSWGPRFGRLKLIRIFPL